MATDSDVLSTRTMVGFFVAGLSLGAVYVFGYTPFGRLLVGAGSGSGSGSGVPSAEQARARATRSKKKTKRDVDVEGEGEGEESAMGTSGVRKGKRKKKSQDKGVGENERGGEGEGHDIATSGGGDAGAAVVPGDFEGASADVGSREASQRTPSVQIPRKKKKKTKKQNQREGKGKDGEEDNDAGSETDKDVRVGRLGVRGPRSGDSTDTSVSRSPTVSGDALPDSARVMGKGSAIAPPRSQLPAQRREDTDSSRTRVDRRRLETSKSTSGRTGGVADAVDATSSDVALTAKELDDAELDNLLAELRGDLPRARVNRTLRRFTERRTPRPRKTNVDDMLEQSDHPTLARVMRVQPRADETPVPGFSWQDYGDVAEDSVLVHDADEEDEGEWGVVRSRNRTRPQPTTTTTTTSASTVTPHAPATPDNMTKKQRQNARKRELTKAAKAEAEAARQQGFAKHKRELERLRIIEQSQQGGGRQPSGGMQATVDDQGKLVWE